MTNTLYILESDNNRKFPYRLTIRQGDKVLLALRVQDRWPGQRGNIFCIRETNQESDFPVEEIKRFSITTIKKILKDSEREGIIEKYGKGKKSYWKKVL